MSCNILYSGTEVVAIVCTIPHWETLGMAPCPRCGMLSYYEHSPLCDLTIEEQEEVEEEIRDESRPDASFEEVVLMLGDRGLVEFMDPAQIEALQEAAWAS